MPIHGFPGGVISSTAVTPSVNSASGVWTLDEQLQAGANWPVAPSFVNNSVRLRSSASAYLSRTFPSAGNRKTWTYSAWVKRGGLGRQSLLATPDTASTNFNIQFDTGNTLSITNYQSTTNTELITTQVFRDPASWYHIVVAFDTTQATASNRVRLWVNGSQVTSFSTATYPAQNLDADLNTAVAHTIGSRIFSGSPFLLFDGYLTDINFIDGQALTPNYFGAIDGATGVWEPAQYRGTYGTNGFYLPMNKTVEDYGIEYLVVAGGGGAGTNFGGGGGGGGYIASSASVAPGFTYGITVGAGGSGRNNTVGNSGSSSSFASFASATGGGGGGGANSANGTSGGSGGGGGAPDTNSSGGSGTAGQGNSGGNGQYNGGNDFAAGGGGGAGAAGTSGVGSTKTSGAGGNGSTWSNGTTYAGGGGGGGFSVISVTVGAGGSGGGGAGSTTNAIQGTSGTANTGGGGGGGGGGGAAQPGGNGGSGIVIIRYLGAQRGTGGTVTSSGGYTYHTFTSSGSYTA
jgi:hypothetical protein